MHSVPGLTAPSSGSQSEAGDHALFADLEVQNQSSRLNDTLNWDDAPSFREPSISRLSSASMHDLLSPQFMAPTSAPLAGDRRSLDLDYMKRFSMPSQFQESNTTAIPNTYADATNDGLASLSVQESDAFDTSESYSAAPTDEISPAYSSVDYSSLGSEPRSITIPADLDDNNWLLGMENPTIDLNFDNLDPDAGLDISPPSYNPWLS